MDYQELGIALTTTEFMVITDDGNNSVEIDLMLRNIPVCVCNAELDLPDEIPPESVLNLARAISTGIDVVEINSNLRTIFIGSDIDNEESALVSHQTFSNTPRINEFFKRWDEIQVLMFQFSVKRRSDNQVIACIRGARSNNQWQSLQLIDEPTLKISNFKEI